ncbi:phage tail protein [Flavobacterium sediminis]|uniref:Phage tail protein n=1 Tax=Flavobacterium sediminis TaxID=2201181 RepID=A0A2U8QRP5_9FLAO|nr:tail fiber protein [Flavobacterium sediminis]AWM12799.1 phage tail protein [Flavobacterium sediminis]
MSTEPFIGEIKLFGFNFAPLGYSLCAGQIISISQYTALFSLIGTTYGGNGQTTFALPDLQGRMPIGQGQGPGLPLYTMGQKAGSTTKTLTTSNLPPHIHSLLNAHVNLQASTDNADELSPAGNFPATATDAIYSGNGATPNTYTGGAVLSGTTDVTGSGIPVDIMNPYLTINFSIAMQGIFPSRN